MGGESGTPKSWIGSENKATPPLDSAECDYQLKVSGVVLGVDHFKQLHLEVND